MEGQSVAHGADLEYEGFCQLCQVLVQKSDTERVERFFLTDIICHLLFLNKRNICNNILPFYKEKNHFCAAKI